MADVSGIPSVDDMLAKAKANAGKKNTAGMTAVQKLLAERDATESPTANMSPVQRVAYELTQSKPKAQEPYTEQEWYIKAKVNQLKAQVQIYSNLPGLDPGGSIMDGLGKEITDLVKKQQAKIKATADEAAAKQAELDKKNAEKNLFAGLPTADQMLKRNEARMRGEKVADFSTTLNVDPKKQAAVDALLKKVGATVNKTV